VTGAVAGLAVAAAIVGPSALASGGGGASGAATTKRAAAGAPGDAQAPFFAAVSDLVRAGTIDAAQGRAVDERIRAGSMDPGQMVASGVLTASQMAAVNDRLIAIKRGVAAQAHVSPVAARAACGNAGG
jgi:hypothetical protein